MNEAVQNTQAPETPAMGYSVEEAAQLFEELEGGQDDAPEVEEVVEIGDDPVESEGDDDDTVSENEDEEATEEEAEEVEYDPETEIDLGDAKVKLADLIETYKNKPDVAAVEQAAVQKVRQHYNNYEAALATNAKTYVENLENGNKLISAILQVNPIGEAPKMEDYWVTGADGQPFLDTQGFMMAQYNHGEKVKNYQTIFQAQQEAHRIAKENEAKENEVLRERVRAETFQLIPDLNNAKILKMQEVAKNVFGLTDDDISNLNSAKAINILWHAVQLVEQRTKDSGALKTVKKAQPKVVKLPSVAPQRANGSKVNSKELKSVNDRFAKTGDRNSAAYLIEKLGL